MQVLVDLFIRCLLAKPWPQDPTGIHVLCPTGKYSKYKVHMLSCEWAAWIDRTYDCGFSNEHDLVTEQDTNENASSQETLDLQALTLLPGINTEAVPELGPKFK